jgi:hypothetical protein
MRSPAPSPSSTAMRTSGPQHSAAFTSLS